MLLILLFSGIIHSANGKLLVIDNKNDLREEIMRRVDCWLWPRENCPQFGTWSDWSSWGECCGECGQVGLRKRSRECETPLPRYAGYTCLGEGHQEVECRMPGCSEADYGEMLLGDDNRLNELKVIKSFHSQYPCLIERCLEAECHMSIVQNIITEQADRYWNALHCVKHNSGCPVNGDWSNWGRWSPCSALCGKGFQIRCHSCDSPWPTYSTLTCKGENCTSKPCQGIICGQRKGSDMMSDWSSWSEWSQCSTSCGQGLSRRKRKCIINNEELDYSVNYDAVNCPTHQSNSLPWVKRLESGIQVEDTLCLGPHVELKPCFLKYCPVDGGWSEWEPWSQCSVACGMGIQFRSRSCTSPSPRENGMQCSGPITHFKHCFLKPCAAIKQNVATFTEDDILKYNDMGKNTELLHIFIRFKPFNSNGIIILRVPKDDFTNYMTLSLISGYIAFSASVNGCRVSVFNLQPVEIGKWLKVLIKVTPIIVTMRINDSKEPLMNKFSCVPKFPNFRSKMTVGLNYTGYIERLFVNYRRRNLQPPPQKVLSRSNLYPYFNENVEYEEIEGEEVFRNLDEIYLIPCSKNPLFSIEVAVRGTSQDGVLMFINDDKRSRFIILSIEPHRVQLHYVYEGGVIECFEVIEPHVGRWMHLKVDYDLEKSWGLTVNGGTRRPIRKYNFDNTVHCSNFIMVGEVARTLHDILGSELKGLNNESLDGLLGYVAVDGQSLDLSSIEGKIESKREIFSSEAISSSLVFVEIKIEPNEPLEMSCSYKNLSQDSGFSTLKPVWLQFDIPLPEENVFNSEINYTITDDYVETVLIIFNYSSREYIEGFYSCWLPQNLPASGDILITYGITVFDPLIEFSTTFRNFLNISWAFFLSTFVISFLWILMEFIFGIKSQWGMFSTRTVKKRLKRSVLCEFFHSPQARSLLGIKTDYIWFHKTTKIK